MFVIYAIESSLNGIRIEVGPAETNTNETKQNKYIYH